LSPIEQCKIFAVKNSQEAARISPEGFHPYIERKEAQVSTAQDSIPQIRRRDNQSEAYTCCSDSDRNDRTGYVVPSSNTKTPAN